MTSLDKLNFTRDTHSAILQIARLDKPSGSWPSWVEEVESLLNGAAREHTRNAKQEMGILRAEQAVS